MSFQKDFSFLVQALSKLVPLSAPEKSMITVVTGHPESFTPDLFQVIKMDDGTYIVQELTGDIDDEGFAVHAVISHAIVEEKDISKIHEMCTKSGPMTLTWGPKPVMTA